MQYAFWITTGINVLLVVAFFVGKSWIKASVERSVQHKFDDRIERIKSDLRAREADIASLRDGALSGRAHRQTLLEKRRIEAVERVWAAVVALAPYKFVSGMMSVINFAAAAEAAATDANTRQFFQMIGGQNLRENGPENPAIGEQPFVTPLAWAYFSAYQTIIVGAFFRSKILQIGLKDAHKFLSMDNTRKLLKTALPKYSDYIDTHEAGDYHFLLDEIENMLLVELRKMLEGEDIDQAGIARSSEIMKLVKAATAESATEAVNADRT